MAIALLRDDVANIVGTARESLGRHLKEIQEGHQIVIGNGKINNVNPTEILKFINSNSAHKNSPTTMTGLFSSNKECRFL
jgi:hypothetical protein